MYVVLMEWDGMKPPTTYYNRLRSLGLRVRGDKEDRQLSPLDRRLKPAERGGSGTVKTIIFQESAVMCASEELSRTIAKYANDCGAKSISIVSGIPEAYHMSTDDQRIMERLESMLGRRGRPTRDMARQDWVVTCMDECTVFQVTDAVQVANCPNCKSPNIFARPGNIPAYAIPKNGNVVDAWKRLRFSSGRFEVCEEGQIDPPEASALVIIGDEAKAVNLMQASKKLVDEVKLIEQTSGRKMALKMLDAVFTAREHLSDNARRDARLQAVIPLYEKGITPQEVSVMESPIEWDVLDGAHIDPRMVANAWLRANGK